jgi:hypothetical protein
MAEALQLARRNAMESAGIEFNAQQLRVVMETGERGQIYDAFARLVRYQACGRILSESPPQYEYPQYPGPEGQPQLWCVARIQADVVADTCLPDPAFHLELKTLRETYREGEEISLLLAATQDCWVTLFNLYANDSLAVVYPNHYWPSRRLSPGKHMTLPPDESVALTAEVLPGHKEDTEMLLAVAVKDSVLFPVGTAIRPDLLISYDEALRRLNTWIMTIPRDRRTEATAIFRVVKN